MRSVLRLLPFALSVITLTGCGTEQHTLTSLPGITFAGTVHGGNQLVSGSTIQLYAAGATGYGSAATPLLTTTVTTGPQGQFSITGDYTCLTPTTQVYITATSGNPGMTTGTNNAALAMMTALGNCGSLSSSTLVIINEVTTVAAAFSLSQFMTDYSHLGASATNSTGLAHAFITANTLAPSSVGQAISAVTFNTTSTAAFPAPRINSLANALAACVNSDGASTPSTPCGLLFAAATPSGGSAPTDTIAAALSIAHNPTSQPGAVFSVAAGNPAFQPTLSTAPTDWALSIAYQYTYLKYFEGSAMDANGDFWYTQSYYTAYANTTVPSFTNSIELDGVSATGPAFDASGKLWVGTSYVSTSNSDHLAVYDPSSGQLLNTYSTASSSTIGYSPTPHFDSLGNNWPSFGSGSAGAVYSATGSPIVTSISGNAGTIADASGGMWGSFTADTLSRSTLSGSTVATTTYTGATGVTSTLAIDHAGNLWSPSGSNLLKFTPATGNTVTVSTYPTYSTGSIAIDGDGNIWAMYGAGLQANKSDGSLLFPATGLAGPANAEAQPAGMGINGSGDVWSICPANGFDSSINPVYVVTDFIGVAAPVVMPFALAAATNTIGTRP